MTIDVLLQGFAVVEVPFLNEPFGTASLTTREWLTSVALASIVLWADELKKLLERSMQRYQG